jgi:hypothetical protein
MGPSYLHEQWSQETHSQEYDQQDDDFNLEGGGEGFVEAPKGRATDTP